MPGFDQTGPQGDGPMSGRAQGICGTARSDNMSETSGFYGQGRGRGQGRGFRCGRGNRFGRRSSEFGRWQLPSDGDSTK